MGREMRNRKSTPEARIMNRTGISYVDFTWNPMIGCSRISPGCGDSRGGGCYAERLASTRLKHLPAYAAVTNERGWNGKVHLMPERLDEPIRRRKPARIFLGDMSDIFHPEVPFEFIAACFGVMAACPQHTFLLLTKRPARMLEFFEWLMTRIVPKCSGPQESTACAWEAWRKYGVELPDSLLHAGWQVAGERPWPLPNVHLGVTCEDQQRANERIPLLLQCPAAGRWISAEPLLGPIDFLACNDAIRRAGLYLPSEKKIDLVIVGGESGPRARPCDVEWIRSIVYQGNDAGCPVFVKQVGSHPAGDGCEREGQEWPEHVAFERVTDEVYRVLRLRNHHGADPSEWPEDLRVREYPNGAA